MTKIPNNLIHETVPGLELLRRGKVRDTYALPEHPDKMLVVASDRISIYDFVLNALVPQKGALLTAMNVFWRVVVMKQLFPHDLLAFGSQIDTYLPGALRRNVALQQRATVVQRLEMLPIEAIVRGCLTGTGLKAYADTQRVCGHRLPEGLADGDLLPMPLFTPTTKAEVGHDEHITADSVVTRFGIGPERLALELFAVAVGYARTRGIILADTKFEFGTNADGALAVGDEVLTPDSSRFWDAREWAAAQAKDPRKSPSAFDKQFVRAWGQTVGMDDKKQFDPKNPDHVARVHALHVPDDIVDGATQIYRVIFHRLSGYKLEAFQQKVMGILVNLPKVHVEVISGSESDVPQMRDGLGLLEKAEAHGEISVRRHVISCHRNPGALHDYARELRENAERNTVVIAGAGMAAQLPGVLKALLRPDIPVIGVAFRSTNEKANKAARLSIEQLPGQPVVLRADGSAYYGPHGFTDACRAAMGDEFLPSSFGNKPALMNQPLFP